MRRIWTGPFPSAGSEALAGGAVWERVVGEVWPRDLLE